MFSCCTLAPEKNNIKSNFVKPFTDNDNKNVLILMWSPVHLLVCLERETALKNISTHKLRMLICQMVATKTSVKALSRCGELSRYK